MKLKEKITGILTAVLLLSASIASVPASALTIRDPQAMLSLEPKRTADGIDYDVYINHAGSLSTLMFAMDFSSKGKGTIILTDNACFDISYSTWSNENNASLKAYFGRTGQKAGFSADEKIKVAQISIPVNISETGEVTAAVTDAVCAGIPEIGSSAVKGTVTVPESTVKYTVRECSVLSVTQNKIDILSSENRRADIIYALYDSQGRLINTYKESADLIQGENEITANAAFFDESGTLSIMIWDSISSMRPLADRHTEVKPDMPCN